MAKPGPKPGTVNNPKGINQYSHLSNKEAIALASRGANKIVANYYPSAGVRLNKDLKDKIGMSTSGPYTRKKYKSHSPEKLNMLSTMPKEDALKLARAGAEHIQNYTYPSQAQRLERNLKQNLGMSTSGPIRRFPKGVRRDYLESKKKREKEQRELDNFGLRLLNARYNLGG